MSDQFKNKQQADAIRAFINKISSSNKTEYKAEGFKKLFALSNSHEFAKQFHPSRPGTPSVLGLTPKKWAL